MKNTQTKTITAISTTINGHTEYIKGQSVRDFDGKYIPQFSTDPVHAKDFKEFKTPAVGIGSNHSDNPENYHDETEARYHAKCYIENIANSFNRVFNIVSVEIPVIKDLKKYDRDNKKQRQLTGHRYQGGIKDGARVRGLI
jgi:hypothetical protein